MFSYVYIQSTKGNYYPGIYVLCRQQNTYKTWWIFFSYDVAIATIIVAAINVSVIHDATFLICHPVYYDAVIKWKHLPCNWHFVRGMHRPSVNSSHKGQWRGALMYSLICAWTNRWANNGDADDLRRHRAHYEVIVTLISLRISGRHDISTGIIAHIRWNDYIVRNIQSFFYPYSCWFKYIILSFFMDTVLMLPNMTWIHHVAVLDNSYEKQYKG